MLNVWLLLYFISLTVIQVLSKVCSNIAAQKGKSGYALMMTAQGVISCIVYYIVGGCKLQCNFRTAGYALTNAGICIANMVFTFMALQMLEVANVNVISCVGSLVATAAMGCLFFGEKMDGLKILRIMIMCIVVFLIFADARKGKLHPGKKRTGNVKKICLVLLILIVAGSWATLIMKFYANDKHVVDNNSFFFFTNAFLIMGGLGWFLTGKGDPAEEGRNKEPEKRKFRTLLMFAGYTVAGNMNAIVGYQVIAGMEVSVYTAVSSALAILSGVAASWLFREKLGACSLIAAAIAIIAVVI